MPVMKIRHSRRMAVLVLVAAALLLGVSLATGQWFSVVTGVLLLVLGTLLLVNPMVQVLPHEVQVRNPLGMTLKRYPLTGPGDLAFQGDDLYHVPSGARVTRLAFGIHRPDVDALRQALHGG